MSDSDLPQGTAEGAALSFNDGVEAISSLNLDSDAPNLEDKVEAKNEADEEVDQPEDELDADADAGADEQEVEQEEDDGPDEVKGGRFAPDTAKVTLQDGTVITVADLKRNNLFQADYTRKTTELRAEKDAFQQERAQVGQVAQSLAQQRDFLLQVAQTILPKAPDRAMMADDPIGYMQAKADYDDRMQVLNQLAYQQNAEKSRQSEVGTQEHQQYRAAEAQRLFDAVPEFRDRKVYDQFWNDAVDIMSEYGFGPDELSEATDHRMYLVMRDVVKYRKALKQAPKVKQEMQGKPPLIKGGKRMDPKAKISREANARSEQLRKTGSFEAGVAALLDLNL